MGYRLPLSFLSLSLSVPRFERETIVWTRTSVQYVGERGNVVIK